MAPRAKGSYRRSMGLGPRSHTISPHELYAGIEPEGRCHTCGCPHGEHLIRMTRRGLGATTCTRCHRCSLWEDDWRHRDTVNRRR